MATRFSRSTPAEETSSAHRGRLATATLWITQIAVGGMFVLAGTLKLAGAPDMVATFDAIGLGQWFRYLTGLLEVGSAIALLVPSLAPFGAFVLAATMVGAVVTHLFIIGGSAVPAFVLLIASVAIVWARRDQLAGALSRLRPLIA